MVHACTIDLCVEPSCVCHVRRRDPSLAVPHRAALLVACMCRVVVCRVGVYRPDVEEERLLEHSSASAQTSRRLDWWECRAYECVGNDGVWAASAHEHGDGDERPEDVCGLELDMEACLHEDIEQLTTRVIMALCVGVARQ